MECLIVIRSYKKGDELNFRETVLDGIQSSKTSAFYGNLFKEITFQLIILFAAIMFIFFGIPISICFSVIPIVILFTYICTYAIYAAKTMEIDQELTNIQVKYMSTPFTCFWVAESFEPYFNVNGNNYAKYSIKTEKEFRESNIDVSSKKKRIVGTIGLTKNFRHESGAWLKRLSVHEKYRHKGIATNLLNVAIQFAVDQGYDVINTVASEYTEAGRLLCLKKGFELKQMYHKQLLGSIVKVLMYELIYRIKPASEYSIYHPKEYLNFRN